MKVQNFRHFTARVKFHEIGTLIGSFCWKYIKFHVKKVQRSYVSWYWRVMQNLNKNWFLVRKMTQIWSILTRALWSLKNLLFDWFLLCNVYNVWPKNAKLKESLTCGLENDMRNLANSHQSTWKCQNCDIDGILVSNVENAWAINLQRSYV